VAEIDLSALLRNLQEIRRVAGPSRPGILAAVKADAYGHGAIEISRALDRGGVTMLGVARIEEGIELREAGIESPILVLSGVPVGGPPPFESLEDRVYELLKYRLTPVLFDLRVMLAIDRLLQRRALESAEDARPVRMDYHLEVDTGMGRIGVPVEALRDALGLLQSMKHLKVAGALTHFSDADDPSESARAFTKAQADAFRSAIGPLQTMADGTMLLHASNSAASIGGIASDLDLIRPGIALYGAYPSPSDHGRLKLEPVMRWTTRVLFVKDVPSGAPISYGRTFTTERPTKVATLPVGYGDGYPRSLSNRGEVLIRGRRAPVIGRVCMDLTMVDVTGIPETIAGDEAVLVGAQGEARMTAEEAASKAGTISYEILTGVSKRVPRVYKT
jgi:alanine racemase